MARTVAWLLSALLLFHSKAMAPEQRRSLFQLFGDIRSELGGVLVAMHRPPVLDDRFEKLIPGGGEEGNGAMHITWVVAAIHKKSFHNHLPPAGFEISGRAPWTRWPPRGSRGIYRWPVRETGC